MFLLGCASLLASVGLGQDLSQLGKLQVGPGLRILIKALQSALEIVAQCFWMIV